jgi:hypothetical protein
MKKSSTIPNKSNHLLALSAAGMFFSVVSTQAAGVWTNLGTGDWLTTGNWDNNTVPSAIAATISNGGTATISADVPSVNTVSVTGGSIVNQTGGTIDSIQSGNTVRNSVGAGSAGTYNQSGGGNNIGHLLRIGANASGVYNLSGGNLDVYRGGDALIGTVSSSISIGVATGAGVMSVSGGSLTTRFGVEIGSTGKFEVLGNAGSITIGGTGTFTNDGHWYQGGTLSMGIGATGVSKIFVSAETGTAQFATFLSTSLVDLKFVGTSPYEGTWTLLELENGDILNQGLSLSAASLADPAGTWTFGVDNTGANGLLTASFSIPEPSTSLALGTAFLLSLGIRRRSRH